jgi:hypothetical protein
MPSACPLGADFVAKVGDFSFEPTASIAERLFIFRLRER